MTSYKDTGDMPPLPARPSRAPGAAIEPAPPTPITRYVTSDGREHKTEMDAVAHETYLVIIKEVPMERTMTPYDVVVALAKTFHFVRREDK